VIRGRSPDEASPSRGAVVVGVDGSPAGESALAMAFDEASWRGADLIAVHTWIEFYSDSSSASAGQFLVDWDALETCERELLAERMAGWQEKYPDVEVRRVVTRDRPVRCLLEHAADAQLLVVGSRGRGGLSGMLLGSTSQALMYHAPCPLLVVRPAATP
jgi:nucleotide-binding universal stress UspA family protein